MSQTNNHSTGLVEFIKKNLSKTFDVIFIALSLLVVLILLTTWYNYQHNSDAIHHFSKELINQVHKRIITKTKNYFFKAVDMTSLSSEVTGEGVGNLLNNPSLEKLMAAILKTHKKLKMFHIGNENGDFLMQMHMTDDSIDMKKIYDHKGSRKVFITDRDINGNIIKRISRKETYDPRTRTWYKGAKEKQHTFWSDVYIFHTGKIPGITVSYPVTHKGDLLGVFALDIPLHEISIFLKELVDDLKSRKRITHANAFILNNKGDVIAYPYKNNQEALAGSKKDIHIRNIKELPDKEIIQSYEIYQQMNVEKSVFTIKSGNYNYIAAYNKFLNSSNHGKQWIVGLVVREDDFIAEIKATNHFLLTTSIVIILFVMCLAFVLNIIKKELKKKNDFIQATFGRYLSDEIVETILATPEGTTLGGEKREVTILMTDLRGFTSISEKLPAESCLKMINIYLDVMTDIILKYHGTIDEFIGDAILAIFGAPAKQPDDVKRSVACAIAMQNAMQEVNRKNIEQGFPEVQMGIGINTGELVVGNIGSSKRTKYGVVGSNVNLTSRIESYTVGGQILVSESTVHACEGLLRIDSQMEVKPKGVKEPITIYEIGGIGGQYNVYLPVKKQIELLPLPSPMRVRFTILSGKHAGNDWFDGNITAYSEKEANLLSAIPLEHLTNLQMEIHDSNRIMLVDEVYAKVIDTEQGESRIHFTASPIDMDQIIEELYVKYLPNGQVYMTTPIEDKS